MTQVSTTTLAATGSWDGVRNVSGFTGTSTGTPVAASSTLDPAQISGGPSSEGLSYYVRFTPYSTSSAFDGSTLYQLDGFSFADDQTLSIGSQSTGAGAGKATFDPLTLRFTQQRLVPDLFKYEASGTPFAEVDVLGYHTDGTLAVDYSFGLAGISDLSASDTGISEVALKYGSESIQTYTNASGSPTLASSDAWNIIRNVRGFSNGSTTAPVTAPLSAPTTLPLNLVSPAVSSPQTVKYYVRFIDYNGASGTGTALSSSDGGTLFSLEDFSFDIEQTLNIGNQSTGAGAGKLTFDPLNIVLDQQGLTPTLFARLTSGTPFKEVDVVAYKPDASGVDTLAAEYSYALAAAQHIQTDESGDLSLSLQYGSEAIQSFTTTAGATTLAATGSWDGVRNVSGFTGTSTGTPVAASSTLDPAQISGGPSSEGLSYYVRFTPYSTSSAFDGSTLYQLDGFSFADDQTLSIGSQSTGAGAGKATFDPLTLRFTQQRLVPDLFKYEASGTPFAEVDVLGYHTDGTLAVDYSFGLAGISDLSASDTGISDVALKYGSESIQTYTNASGSPTLASSDAWNIIRNVRGFSNGSTTAPVTAPLSAPTTLPLNLVSPAVSSPQTVKYYVRFIDYNGASGTGTALSSSDGGTLFSLEDFSFDIEQTLNIGNQSTGAGAGKLTFDPLNIVLDQQGLTPTLFARLTSGTPFKEVDVVAYKPDASGVDTLAAEYSYALAAAQHIQTDESGDLSLSLQYGSEAIQSFTTTAGATTLAATGSWDGVRNVSGFTGTSTGTPVAASSTLDPAQISGGPSSEGLSYYVRFTPYSTSSAFDGSTLYQLDGFSFADDQTLSIGSQSTGAGAGKATFDPLTLRFTQQRLVPDLFKYEASGTPFAEVDVLGYHTDGTLAVDYSFGLAGISDLSASDTGISEVALKYGSESIQTYTNASGSPTLASSDAWNIIRNVRGFSNGSTTAPVTAPLSAPTTLPLNLVSPAVSSPQTVKYYVRFIDYNGASGTGTALSSSDGGTLFSLEDFSFDIEQTLNIGNQSTGAGAGKLTFDPLNIVLDQQGLTPTLFARLTSGTPFKEVDVVAYKPDASGVDTLAAEYSYALAAAQHIQTDESGDLSLSLQYGSEAIQSFTTTTSGSNQGDQAGTLSLDGLTDGNALEGTAIIATVSDPDGNPSSATYTFSDAAGTLQSGASNTYIPNHSEVGEAINVSATYTDGKGHIDIAVGSAGTVQEIDHAGTLSLSGLTSGNATAGRTVVATISDPDGPPIGATYTFTLGGTAHTSLSNSYTPDPSEVGESFRVSASYSDGENHSDVVAASGGVVGHAPVKIPSDFNGDGVSDVLFRDPSTGDYGFVAATGTGSETWHPLGLSNPSYSARSGDFNGDGLSDILFRSDATGDYGFQAVTTSGGQIWHGLGPSNPSYAVVGSADYNGDGVSDILFRNNATGDYGYEALTATEGKIWHPLGSSNASYAVVGSGDYNGDGVSDVLFRNNSTGDYGFEALTATGGQTWQPLGSSDPSYAVVGSGDFNNDGVSDVLFRNNVSGDYGYQALTSSGGQTWIPAGSSDPSYAVVGTGGFGGSGDSDVLFRNNSTGDYGFETVTAAGGQAWHPLGGSSSSYSVV